jgi:phospholipid-binding lipoprotein MlaA
MRLNTRLRVAARLPMALVLAGLLAVSACAARPDPADPVATAEHFERNDPLETLNRGTFFVNDALDTLFIKPAAEFYRILVPPPVRGGVRNVLANLREPVTLLHDGLQGNGPRAGNTAARFAINTTLGVGGLFDAATDNGFPREREDMGQTLAVWGIDDGPYLVLPLLGPSNFRDTIGRVFDYFADPWQYIDNTEVRDLLSARNVVEVLDSRESLIEPLDQINRTSLDPYATIRSVYRQRRALEIRNEPVTVRPSILAP